MGCIIFYFSRMKLKLLLLLSCIASIPAFAQTYNGPESVEYDYVNRRWLIGNTGSHQILSRDSLNNLTVLVSNTASGPHGIEIMGDTLYCCSGASIKGYLLSSGVQVFTMATGGSFLNGLTHDNSGNLITTDFSAKKIFKINPASNSIITIATGMTTTPNGIIYDESNNRCVFVNWGANAPVKSIDLSTNTISTLLNTALSNCDGIARDGAGRFYISNWGQSLVVRYDSAFMAPPTTVATGLSSPADIFYNVVDDTLGIPNSGNNTVTFVGFASSVGIADLILKDISVFPNPVQKGATVKISASQTESFTVKVTDQHGRLLKEFYSVNEINTDDIDRGVYFVEVDGRKSFKVVVY
jgi:hypothetical protein